MKVTTGTKFGPGLDRSVDIELEGADGAKVFGEDWEGLTTAAQFKRLSAYADILVLQYLLRDEEVHPDFFNKRLKELSKDLQAK